MSRCEHMNASPQFKPLRLIIRIDLGLLFAPSRLGLLFTASRLATR